MPSPCPTGNQSGDQWQAPGSHALDELLFQAMGAWGVVTDLGTGNLKFASSYSGASGTGPTQVGPCLFGVVLCATPAQPGTQYQTPEQEIPCDVFPVAKPWAANVVQYEAAADCAEGVRASYLGISWLFFSGPTLGSLQFVGGSDLASCRDCGRLLQGPDLEPVPDGHVFVWTEVEFTAYGPGYLFKQVFEPAGLVYLEDNTGVPGA